MPELLEDESTFYGTTISPTAIALIDGHLFDIMDPSTWVFNVETIAFALSNLCRFNGHCNFYSIAEHSVRVSKLIEEWGGAEIVQYLGLHHDDIEAYITDVPSPHKGLMDIAGEPYKTLEESMEYAYFATLGVLDDHFENYWAMVKAADLEIYLRERSERPALGRSLSPLMARAEYMERHRELAYLFAGNVPHTTI